MQIHTLDLHFQGLEHAIASYLIEGDNECFLIESGPASTLPALHAALRTHGLQPSDIRHLLVTHIHLDHAGAAGWWAQQGTHVYVHHVGAPHLVDPTRLLQSAGRIYGDRMEPLWGSVMPAPADRVTALADGDAVTIDGIELVAQDTPGHAWHHHVFQLDDIAFCGDAAGVRMPGAGWISVPAVPPEFKLEVWLATLDRLEAADFRAVYPTHFGRVDDPAAHFAAFRPRLVEAADFVRADMEAGLSRDKIVEHYRDWNREIAAGVSPEDFDRYEAANPLYMSVDGLMRYWSKQVADR